MSRSLSLWLGRVLELVLEVELGMELEGLLTFEGAQQVVRWFSCSSVDTALT